MAAINYHGMLCELKHKKFMHIEGMIQYKDAILQV